MSLSPSRVDDFKYRETLAPVRTLIRESFRDDPSGGRGLNGHNGHGPDAHSSPSSLRIGRRSPSVAKERTRDELIDSIVHTRTREHRVMPGFHNASDWEERKAMGIDCDKVRRPVCPSKSLKVYLDANQKMPWPPGKTKQMGSHNSKNTYEFDLS